MLPLTMSPTVSSVELGRFIRTGHHPAACKEVDKSLKQTGLVNVQPSEFYESLRRRALAMFQRYFAQSKILKERDWKPKLNGQRGWTPDDTEYPNIDRTVLARVPHGHEPHPTHGQPDNKERFIWDAQDRRPRKSAFPGLNAPNVIPVGFEQWEEVSMAMARMQLEAGLVTLSMLAVANGMSPHYFYRYTRCAPHILAPTGSNYLELFLELLIKHTGNVRKALVNLIELILAGWHYDMNAVTVHPQGTHPGLFAWLRDLEKFPVCVERGHFLIQAARELEYVTGGAVFAGYHEVIVTEEVVERIRTNQSFRDMVRRIQDFMKERLWNQVTVDELYDQSGIMTSQELTQLLIRIGLPLFLHFRSDSTLKPGKIWSTCESRKAYPAIVTGVYHKREIAKTIKPKKWLNRQLPS